MLCCSGFTIFFYSIWTFFVLLGCSHAKLQLVVWFFFCCTRIFTYPCLTRFQKSDRLITRACGRRQNFHNSWTLIELFIFKISKWTSMNPWEVDWMTEGGSWHASNLLGLRYFPSWTDPAWNEPEPWEINFGLVVAPRESNTTVWLQVTPTIRQGFRRKTLKTQGGVDDAFLPESAGAKRTAHVHTATQNVSPHEQLQFPGEREKERERIVYP